MFVPPPEGHPDFGPGSCHLPSRLQLPFGWSAFMCYSSSAAHPDCSSPAGLQSIQVLSHYPSSSVSFIQDMVKQHTPALHHARRQTACYSLLMSSHSPNNRLLPDLAPQWWKELSTDTRSVMVRPWFSHSPACHPDLA